MTSEAGKPRTLGERRWLATDGQTALSFPLTSGNTNWTYTPSDLGTLSIVAAKSDGGLTINDSAAGLTQLDSGGNPSALTTNPTTSIPSYSWHGDWYALVLTTGNAVGQMNLPAIVTASTWAFPLGSPSADRSSGRPWSFILVWQNDWSFIPDYPSIVSQSSPLRIDISSLAPIIKAAALKEVHDAYSGVSVVVAEGTAGTGDDRATIMNAQTLNPNSASCGGTDPNALGSNFRTHDSQVSYVQIMEEAQIALQIAITSAQQENNALNSSNSNLLQAIGRGLGDTAAHEIAHQFLVSCCTMDSNPLAPGQFNPDPNAPDPAARGAFNATGCSGATDPSPWTGFWPNPIIYLHWEPPAQSALGCLGKRWSNFSGPCHN